MLLAVVLVERGIFVGRRLTDRQRASWVEAASGRSVNERSFPGRIWCFSTSFTAAFEPLQLTSALMIEDLFILPTSHQQYL